MPRAQVRAELGPSQGLSQEPGVWDVNFGFIADCSYLYIHGGEGWHEGVG